MFKYFLRHRIKTEGIIGLSSLTALMFSIVGGNTDDFFAMIAIMLLMLFQIALLSDLKFSYWWAYILGTSFFMDNFFPDIVGWERKEKKEIMVSWLSENNIKYATKDENSNEIVVLGKDNLILVKLTWQE